MLDFLSQIIPAAQDDGGGIGNLLFLVFVGVVWIVGGILKARARKSAAEEPEAAPAQPERKAPSFLAELRKLKLELIEEAAPRVVKPAVGAPAKPQNRQVQRPVEKEKVAPAKLVSEEPELVTQTAFKPLGLEHREKPEETEKIRPRLPSVDYVVQGDQLKTAIIYSEILGKPVALRDM
ncbi:MAG: hypothetical protein MUO22_07485 [Sedimentisphaerales bacterium]|jgi:hypothetical protein|nr:hypothetical protein [Sedimentisphaerales bacterium]